jgi:hypothetical protein
MPWGASSVNAKQGELIRNLAAEPCRIPGAGSEMIAVLIGILCNTFVTIGIPASANPSYPSSASCISAALSAY